MGYRRARERNKRLKKLYDETKTSYGAGAYYCERKKRFVKYSCCCASLRRLGNRRYRRYVKTHDVPAKAKRYHTKYYGYWYDIT